MTERPWQSFAAAAVYLAFVLLILFAPTWGAWIDSIALELP